MSDRAVTGCSRLRSLAGTFHDLRIELMSGVDRERPSCASRSAAIAVTGLLMDAAWKSVFTSPARPVSTSATPYAWPSES